MKQLLPTQARQGSTALILLFILPMMTNTAASQEQQLRNINVNNYTNNTNLKGNQLLNDRTISIPTGPNGPGSVQAININVIDNGPGPNISGGPNVRGYTSSVIPKQTVTGQVTNKPKTTRPAVVKPARPKPSVVGSTTTHRPKPKPKPKPTTAAPVRRVVRPAVVSPAVAAPVQAQVQDPVSNPVVPGNNNPPLAMQQVLNNDVIVQTGHVAAASAPVVATENARAVRSGSSSSGASSGKSHKSGRKKHGGFYYATNKKMMKLFAKNKKGNFDPAKCFVWK